ncbi:MAG: hypothetical protein H0Z35_13670 [Thermoanaerobacteraceae bacterium]|nr:hypothetical protein [Thermoanaerobacteraceae bacterium]
MDNKEILKRIADGIQRKAVKEILAAIENVRRDVNQKVSYSKSPEVTIWHYLESVLHEIDYCLGAGQFDQIPHSIMGLIGDKVDEQIQQLVDGLEASRNGEGIPT